ncbi:MAG TPA: iron-sulfur cluster assembly protein [Acidobacteriaceae bacterium]|nr:iron-sulfur cluster assembly protein [Acidobacteriaceae bacterium]
MPAPAQSATLTEAAVLAALRDCYHPELGANLVELGAVQRVALAPDPDAPGAGIPGVPPRVRVRVELTLPPSASDATDSQIAAIVRNRLAAFESVSVAEVVLLGGWTPERIAPELRERLNAGKQTTTHGLVHIR